MRTRPASRRFFGALFTALLVPLCALPGASAQESPRAAGTRPNEIQVAFQTGHGSSIVGVAMSADGRLLASRAWDQTLRIWEVASGQELRTIAGLDREVGAGAFVGDTTRVVVGGGSAMLQVIDGGSGRTLEMLAQEGDASAVSALGRVAAIRAAGAGSLIRIIDLASGRELGSVRVGMWSTPLSVSDDGRTLFVQTVEPPDPKKIMKLMKEGKVPFPQTQSEVWDVASGKHHSLPVKIDPGGGSSTSLLSPDGRLLALELFDGTLTVYDTAQGKQLAQWPGETSNDSGSANTLVFSPDARLIAHARQGKSGVSVWDIASGRLLSQFDGTAVNFSADGRTLVVGRGGGGAPLLRDLQSGRETPLEGGASAVWDLALVDDGRAVVAATESGGARLWDLVTGQLVRGFQCAGGSQVQTVSVSAKQPWLATGCRDGAVQLWNLDGTLLRTLVAPTPQVLGVNAIVRFDLSGTRLAVALNDRVSVWDVGTSRQVSQFAMPPGKSLLGNATVSLAMSNLPEAQRSAILEQMNNPKLVAVQNAIMAIAFHPDGKRLAIAQGGSLSLWDTSTGQRLRDYSEGADAEPGSDGARSLSFSTDGRQIIALGLEGEVVWDVESARPVAGARTAQANADDDSGNALLDAALSRGVAVSPDGRFAARGLGKNVEVWELQNGRTVASLVGHLSDVSSVAFAAGGRLLVSGGRDGAVRLWSLPEGRPVMQFIALGTSDYVAVTPDQFYRASKRRISGVSFRVGDQLYPFEQFDLRFNRPDVVLARLGRSSAETVQAYRSAYERRLRRMGISEAALNGDAHLPEMQIVDTKIPVTMSATSLSLQVRASDSSFTLDRINVFLNDVPVFGTAGLPVADRSARSVAQTIQVPLVPGRNKIQVSVLNSQGVESLRQTAYTSSTASFAPPDVYLVAIGVSEYQNHAYNLRFAAKDAADLMNAYRTVVERAGAHGAVHVLDLTNAKATRAGIRQAKEWLMQAKSNDLVVVFAAGHGMTDAQQNYYFGTYDIDPAHPETNGLPYEDFEGLLDGIASLQKVLLIDTCFSGEIDKDEATVVAQAQTGGAGTVSMRAFKAARGVTVVGDANSSAPGGAPASGEALPADLLRFQQDLFADLRRGTGAVVISSASGNEYALEGDQWRNGVFTYALLSGLKNGKADKNADARITVSELQSFVIEQVRELTAGGQNPTVRRENLDYDFTVF